MTRLADSNRPLRTLALFLAVASALLIVACGDDDGDETTEVEQTVSTKVAQEAEREARCQAVPEPKPRSADLERPDDLTPEPGTVTFETSCGAFTVELDIENQPETAASVEYLVREGFYDGLTIHRVVADFLIQGGDPNGDGTGGPGYFVDEPPPEETTYTKWTVAMAKTKQDPSGRSGSQFFVVLAEDSDLRPNQAVMGEVVAGFETVERIGLIGPPGAEGEPIIPVTIEKAVFYPTE
jgi:cyclophilin family peptidyl-prolyl cis-trans isomerase